MATNGSTDGAKIHAARRVKERGEKFIENRLFKLAIQLANHQIGSNGVLHFRRSGFFRDILSVDLKNILHRVQADIFLKEIYKSVNQVC